MLFVLGSEILGSIGSIFTIPSIKSWYIFLQKPPFTPPNWVFGPAWGILFLLMGIAAYLVWAKGYQKKDVKHALNIFIIQFGFNILWSVVFFGLQSPLFGFIEIVVLWLLIRETYLKFKQIDELAGYLLLPYLVWVTFASYLNFGVMMLNR